MDSISSVNASTNVLDQSDLLAIQRKQRESAEDKSVQLGLSTADTPRQTKTVNPSHLGNNVDDHA